MGGRWSPVGCFGRPEIRADSFFLLIHSFFLIIAAQPSKSRPGRCVLGLRIIVLQGKTKTLGKKECSTATRKKQRKKQKKKKTKKQNKTKRNILHRGQGLKIIKIQPHNHPQFFKRYFSCPCRENNRQKIPIWARINIGNGNLGTRLVEIEHINKFKYLHTWGVRRKGACCFFIF
jgi:hypothetical protein